MKKQYIAPSTTVMESELLQLVCTSGTLTTGFSSESATEDACSRRRGGWSDEDE